jgi:hypothetical protein
MLCLRFKDINFQNRQIVVYDEKGGGDCNTMSSTTHSSL